MKKAMSLLLALVMVLSLAACGSGGSADDSSSGTTLVYGSADYTRINPRWMSTGRSTSYSSTV